MQDINTIIADFVNAAVERKVKEELQAITERIEELDKRVTGLASSGTTLNHLLNHKIRIGTLEDDVIKLKANNIYTPDHVMARISYIEGHVRNLPNEASIKQMIEDEIGESQQKVEDMIDEKLGTDLEDTVKEKIEQRLDDELDDKIADALDDAITEGKIAITFMR
jgi:SpoVK/Ycf46/Vps4 family AAA+-type ATPase